MNLAVHLFSFIAFGGCIITITGLHYRTQLTQKLLLALFKSSATSTFIITEPRKILSFICQALQIPLTRHISLQQLKPNYKHSYHQPTTAFLIKPMRWLKRAQPQCICLRELLVTLKRLNINCAQYHEKIIYHSFRQFSLQESLTLVVSATPATDFSKIEHQLAEHLNIHVKIMVDHGTEMNHHN